MLLGLIVAHEEAIYAKNEAEKAEAMRAKAAIEAISAKEAIETIRAKEAIEIRRLLEANEKVTQAMETTKMYFKKLTAKAEMSIKYREAYNKARNEAIEMYAKYNKSCNKAHNEVIKERMSSKAIEAANCLIKVYENDGEKTLIEVIDKCNNNRSCELNYLAEKQKTEGLDKKDNSIYKDLYNLLVNNPDKTLYEMLNTFLRN